MKIIGCDFHTRYQQIAMMDEATGELTERRLDHESGEAQAFYRELPECPTLCSSKRGDLDAQQCQINKYRTAPNAAWGRIG